MDITAFIRELLFGHDCVIIPGFGGFIGNYTPARIDKTTSTFHPPVKQISFNRNLNHNDGLLIGRISESAGLNYADARNLVEEFALSISTRLSKGEKVKFDHIGTFCTNHEGNLQFEPDRDSNFNLNSFGLTSFQFLPLEGYDVRKRIVRHSDKDAVKHTPFRKYLWRAAVIVPLLGVLVAVPLTTDIFRSKVQTTNLNPLASVELETNKSATAKGAGIDSVRKPSGGEDNTASAEVRADKTPEAGKPDASLNPSSEEYRIITGSFKSQGNANILMQRLTGEGYVPEVVGGPNGFIRVSAAKCSNLEEALRKKESLAKDYPGAWIIRTK